VVWIVTLGRKSGQWRRNPLLAVADTLPSGESAWVVTGSNAGQAKVPGWVFNARDNAAGFIEIDGAFFRATFVEALDHDRDDLYERLTQIWSSYAMYADHAGRYIPVFRVVVGDPVEASEVPA
jgi:deazaflavin-dependent oxidoreductase (nitroreductase family)